MKEVENVLNNWERLKIKDYGMLLAYTKYVILFTFLLKGKLELILNYLKNEYEYQILDHL